MMITTTLLSLAVDEVGPQPKNVRRDDTPDAELIASVKFQGILQPLVVVPAPDDADVRYWLLMGHRRLAAALAARLEQVPAIVREDLAGEAEQIEAMLVENGRRADLTPVEEADAYQQLTLLGVDVDEISRTTGRSTSTVRGRLKIAGMATAAKEALHARQITLEQAEQLTELEEDHELHADAFAAIGTDDFAWKLQSAVRRLRDRREWAATIAEWKAEGLDEIERPETSWDYTNGPCPDTWLRTEQLERVTSWAYSIDEQGRPQRIAVAIAPASEAEDDEARAERERKHAEWEAKQEADRVARERHEAAGVVRLQTIADTFASTKLTKAQAGLLRVLVASLLQSTYGGRSWLVEHDGLEHDGNHWSITLDHVTAHLAKKSAAELLTIVGLYAAEAIESAHDLARADSHRRTVAAYLDALEAAGHPISEPDTEWRAAAAAADDETEEA